MSTNDEIETSWQYGWKEQELAQLKYFRSLTLRQKMEAIEQLGEVWRRLQEARSRRLKKDVDASDTTQTG